MGIFNKSINIITFTIGENQFPKSKSIFVVDIKEYINHFHYKSGVIDKEKVKKYLDKYSVINTLFSSGPAVPYLLDLTKLNYPFFCKSSERILGISAVELMNKGIETFVSRVHPDDRKVMHYQIIPDFQRILCTSQQKHIKNLRFTFDYRFRFSDTKYIHCLEQTVILETDQYKNPLLNFGIITDISEFKKDNAIIGTVSLLNKKNEYETIYTRNYTSDASIIYSNREMDVIRLLAKGLSSKEIGVKLNISSQTVDKHRRNMLHKAQMKNTQELVYDAIRQGWL